MIKNLVQLEHTIGDKVYRLACDNDSPLNEIKDALFQFLKIVGNIEDQIKAKQASQEEKKPEDPIVDISPANEKAE